MKTFRRLSAAVAFAGDRPYIRIAIGSDRIYIVPDEGEELGTSDGVELCAGPLPRSGSREITGHVSFGHLDRLGNANGAAAAPGEYKRRKTFTVERRRGLAHRFQAPAEASLEAADRVAFLALARDATWSDPALKEKTEREAAEFAADREAILAAARQPADPVTSEIRVETQADGTFAIFRDGGFQRGGFKVRSDALRLARDMAGEAEEAEGRKIGSPSLDEIAGFASAVPERSTVIRGIDRYSDVDPRDLDPATGRPVAGYSSPSLDDSFHRGEMDVD